MYYWQLKEVVKGLALGTSLTQLVLLALKPANVPKMLNWKASIYSEVPKTVKT